MSLARLNELFAGVAAELNFTGTLLDEQGNCTITLKNGLPNVHLQYDAMNDVIDIFSRIGYVPDDDPGIYRELLADNLWGKDMRFTVYALDPVTGHVVLRTALPVSMLPEPKALADLLCSFVDNVIRGRRRLYRKARDGKESSEISDVGGIRV